MQEDNKEEKNILETISCDLEKIMTGLQEQTISKENVDYLYKLEDIHKDIANEFYWKEKMDNMRYMNFSSGSRYNDGYGRRSRDSRGRYMESSGYGRQYRGEEYLMDMQDQYGDYSYGREKYGHDSSKTLDSLDAMLESAKDFFKHLMRNAKSQEEAEMIKETAREISEM